MTKRTLFTVLVGLFAFAGAMLRPCAVSAQSFQCQPSVRIDKSDCKPWEDGANGPWCPGMNYRNCSNPIGNPDCNADCTDQTTCSTGVIFTGSVCSSNDTCILGNSSSTITTVGDCSRCRNPADQMTCEDNFVSGATQFSCITGYSCGCSRSVAYCGMAGTVPVPTGETNAGCNSVCPASGCPAGMSCVNNAAPGGQPGCWAPWCNPGAVNNCPTNFNAYFGAGGNLVSTWTRGGWTMRYRINVNKLNPDGTVQGLVETGGPCDPTYAGLNWFSDCQAKGINEGDCAKRICKYTIDGQNKDSYTAHNVQDINYGDDGYGAPENLDGFGIHVDATSHTVPASMFASLAPGTTIQVVLDGADGPPDMKPVCDPVERRITIPVPPRNSCEVHVVPSTSLVGSTMTVSAGAGIADPSVGKMQVWLEKKDGTQIASYATAVGYTYNGGTVGTITETHPASGNYYYRLNELTCNGPAGTSCSAPTGNVQIQNPNDYYFHCDVVPNGGGSSRPPPPTL